MKKLNWSRQVIYRYALFQIPSLGLLIIILILVWRWVDLPDWIFWCSIALWIAKDIFLFPLVWQSYDRNRLKDLYSLIGVEGIVERQLRPSGYIRIRGELWQAEVRGDTSPIGKGKGVRVIGTRGLKLIVEPNEKEKN